MCWHIECSTFTASSFRIWNSSTGIPSPPLALFVGMLPKAHLTSHSRMSGSRWVITPSWLSGIISKGEKERYKHLNAEFQRIGRRDKKAFLSDQCREIEGNNRMGKTRDLFKKIRDTKGTFHARMGSIKDRNGMDLTEAEDIKKRWQEYTEELYKKDLHERKRVRKKKGYIFPFLLCLLSQIITMVWSLT